MAEISPIPETELEHLVTPYFRHETIENIPQSELQQRPVMEVREVVELRFAGDKNYAPVMPVDAMYRRDGHRVITYAERFADQYRAFQNGEDQKAAGTPLEMLADFGITPAQLSLCRVAKVYSIEALNDLDGHNLKTLGHSANALKEMARNYMAGRSRGVAAVDEVAALKAEIERLKSAIPAHNTGAPEIEAAAAATNKPLADMDDAELKALIKAKTGQAPRGTPSREWLLNAAGELAAA